MEKYNRFDPEIFYVNALKICFDLNIFYLTSNWICWKLSKKVTSEVIRGHSRSNNEKSVKLSQISNYTKCSEVFLTFKFLTIYRLIIAIIVGWFFGHWLVLPEVRFFVVADKCRQSPV